MHLMYSWVELYGSRRSVGLHWDSDTNEPELAQTSQVKGMAPSKTILISDATCQFGGPQATHTF